jgi:hypothetical protein
MLAKIWTLLKRMIFAFSNANEPYAAPTDAEIAEMERLGQIW